MAVRADLRVCPQYICKKNNNFIRTCVSVSKAALPETQDFASLHPPSYVFAHRTLFAQNQSLFYPPLHKSMGVVVFYKHKRKGERFYEAKTKY